jgi:AsmA family protein
MIARTVSPSPAGRRTGRRWLAAGLAGIGIVGVAIAVLTLTDNLWLRPLVQRYVLAHSGRSLHFDALRFGLTPQLAPTLEMRNLRIANAPWAASRPFVEAGLIRFTMTWPGLLKDRPVITRLALVDAKVDLERQADGLRNWRLSRPLDRGPGRIRVLALDATRSELRVVDRGLDLELALHFDALAPDAASRAPPNPALVKALKIDGRRAGLPFTVDAAIGEVLTFGETGLDFPLRGTLHAGAATLRFDGRAGDVQRLDRLDADLKLTGQSLAGLAALLPAVHWPAAPVQIDGHVTARTGHWRFAALQAKAGQSDLRGEIEFDQTSDDRPRPMLRARLHSTAAHFDDIARLRGHAAPGKPDFRRLQALDADIDWKVDHLVHPTLPWLQNLQASGTLRDGRLDLQRLELGLADGRAAGTLQLDSRPQPPTLALEAEFTGLRFERLWPEMTGALQGHAVLRSQGDTVEAFSRAIDGAVNLKLRDATITRKLEARLALDGGAMLRSMFSGDARAAVPCGLLAVDFKHGRGQVRTFVLATASTVLTATGAIDLAAQWLDLVVTPHRKESALFALDRSWRIRGPLRGPGVKLADSVAPSAAVSASVPETRCGNLGL